MGMGRIGYPQLEVCQVWWYPPGVPVIRKWKGRDGEFQANLGYLAGRGINSVAGAREMAQHSGLLLQLGLQHLGITLQLPLSPVLRGPMPLASRSTRTRGYTQTHNFLCIFVYGCLPKYI